MPQTIDFSDLGAKPVQASGPISFDDLGGKPVQAAPQANFASEEQPSAFDEQIPLTSYGNAMRSGFQSVARGVRDAVTGVGNMIAHPIDTAKGIASLPSQVAQVPAAVSDINKSADPLGTYAKVGQETAGQGAGQALTALATEGLTRLPAVAESAKGVVSGANLKSAGGALFNAVDKAAVAANLTVDASRAADAALDLLDNVEVGGKNTQIIRKFLNRVSDPAKGPLSYQEARGFYSNASNLGFGDTSSMTGTTKYLFNKFTNALDADIRDATSTIGQDQNYSQAMAQYSKAKARGERYDTLAPMIGKAAVKGAAGAVGAGAIGVPLYELFKSH